MLSAQRFWVSARSLERVSCFYCPYSHKSAEASELSTTSQWGSGFLFCVRCLLGNFGYKTVEKALFLRSLCSHALRRGARTGVLKKKCVLFCLFCLCLLFDKRTPCWDWLDPRNSQSKKHDRGSKSMFVLLCDVSFSVFKESDTSQLTFSVDQTCWNLRNYYQQKILIFLKILYF